MEPAMDYFGFHGYRGKDYVYFAVWVFSVKVNVVVASCVGGSLVFVFHCGGFVYYLDYSSMVGTTDQLTDDEL